MESRSVTQRLRREIANEMNLFAHTHTPHHVAQINERDKGLESGGVSGIRGQRAALSIRQLANSAARQPNQKQDEDGCPGGSVFVNMR